MGIITLRNVPGYEVDSLTTKVSFDTNALKEFPEKVPPKNIFFLFIVIFL
jgi:hypothetical protein